MIVSRSVGRIQVRTSTGQLQGYGTGFMVSPRLLLTNNHVLGSVGEASNSWVEFNYQDDTEGSTPVIFDLEPETFFLTDGHLDYSLIAVSDNAHDGGILQFGWNRLIEEQGKAIVGEYVNVVQHPNGEPKQLALRENQIVDELEDFLHYQTDTAPGSSGSPVFNDQWEAVAFTTQVFRERMSRVASSQGKAPLGRGTWENIASIGSQMRVRGSAASCDTSNNRTSRQTSSDD